VVATPRSGKPPPLQDRCDVALNIFRDTECSDKALLREAQLAQASQPENIVRVYGVGPMDGLFCMEMEFLDGWTLSERISAVAGHPLPALEEVLNWTDRVADHRQQSPQRPRKKIDQAKARGRGVLGELAGDHGETPPNDRHTGKSIF
jgi:hypothetical protein